MTLCIYFFISFDLLGDMDKYDIFYPSVRSGSVQQQQQQQQSRHHSRRVRAVSEMDEADSFLDDSGGLVYRISAPVFFEDNLHLQLIPATDFISPGFVIQRVSGNYTWLEQIGQDPKLDCFFSGYVLGHEDSTVSLAMCDGMVGFFLFIYCLHEHLCFCVLVHGHMHLSLFSPSFPLTTSFPLLLISYLRPGQHTLRRNPVILCGTMTLLLKNSKVLRAFFPFVLTIISPITPAVDKVKACRYRTLTA